MKEKRKKEENWSSWIVSHHYLDIDQNIRWRCSGWGKIGPLMWRLRPHWRNGTWRRSRRSRGLEGPRIHWKITKFIHQGRSFTQRHETRSSRLDFDRVEWRIDRPTPATIKQQQHSWWTRKNIILFKQTPTCKSWRCPCSTGGVGSFEFRHWKRRSIERPSCRWLERLASSWWPLLFRKLWSLRWWPVALYWPNRTIQCWWLEWLCLYLLIDWFFKIITVSIITMIRRNQSINQILPVPMIKMS